MIAGEFPCNVRSSRMSRGGSYSKTHSTILIKKNTVRQHGVLYLLIHKVFTNNLEDIGNLCRKIKNVSALVLFTLPFYHLVSKLLFFLLLL